MLQTGANKLTFTKNPLKMQRPSSSEEIGVGGCGVFVAGGFGDVEEYADTDEERHERRASVTYKGHRDASEWEDIEVDSDI